MSQPEQEAVLSRWSRRKRQAEEESRQEGAVLESIDPDRLEIEAASSNGELENVEPRGEPVLTDEDMPPIESLNEDSDFSLFMSSGVSDKLRNLALRKMFHVPAFNIRDGLDDYDEDYTYFEKLGDIVTCDMKHQIEMQEKKKQEEAEALALAEDESTEQENIESVDQVAETSTQIESAEEDQQEYNLEATEMNVYE